MGGRQPASPKLDTSSVASFLKTFCGPKSPDLEFGGFRLAYAGDFENPAFNWGGWGFLPVGGFTNGDITALGAAPGTPLAGWPVFRHAHEGDPGECFASSLSTWVAAHIATFEANSKKELAENREKILAFARFTGDGGRAEAVIDAVLRGKLPKSDKKRVELAEGEESLVAAYHGAKDWRRFVRQFPRYAPGRYRLFEMLAAKGGGDGALEAAWEAACLDIQLGGELDAAREAARFVSKKGEKKHGKDPRFAAVKAMADDSPCGLSWLRAGEALEKKDPSAAYACFKNAAHWFNAEVSENPSVTWMGGKRCAKAMGDKNLLSLFRELEERDDEDLDALISQYEKPRKKPAAAEPRKADPGNELVWAAKTGDLGGIRAALDAGAHVDSCNTSYDSALIVAGKAGQREAVALLIERGANVNREPSTFHDPPLTAVLREGEQRVEEIARQLIEAGADVNAPTGNTDGASALHMAAKKGFVDTVGLLLARGADRLDKDKSGKTPRDWAAGPREAEIASLLTR
jgi:hypothetical protein